MNLAMINQMSREEFTSALGGIFEDSPWVAQRSFIYAPFGSPVDLVDAMVSTVENAATEDKLALLRAHPDLGTRARISAASAGEQAGAGLDSLTPPEYEELLRMNTAYKERFGFPFLYAVKGANKEMILTALRERIANSVPDEFNEALRQVFRIARFRLEDLLDEYK